MLVRRRPHDVPSSSNAIVYTESEVPQLYEKAEKAFVRFQYLHHLLSSARPHRWILVSSDPCSWNRKVRMDRFSTRNDTCAKRRTCSLVQRFIPCSTVSDRQPYSDSANCAPRLSSLDAPKLSDEKKRWVTLLADQSDQATRALRDTTWRVAQYGLLGLALLTPHYSSRPRASCSGEATSGLFHSVLSCDCNSVNSHHCGVTCHCTK
jgi:hypothetical protein